eukprot:TRINITY_DN10679_c0_g1_i1.p1 TRINITY_DN10679_c0_g1~~TRINITY_DN10679_c0_g1_i1.p1  ORF type:complete len:417 (-),score=80.37 TRINITY_DN10679_c0_g1_i1:51-1301(-)
MSETELINTFETAENAVTYGKKERQYSIKDESWGSLFRRINWISSSVLIATPLIGLYGLLFVEKHPATIAWAIIYYFCTGLGITAGYHRLFSHQAYKAHWTVRYILLAFGSGAVQGSCRWWSRGHRVHHRFTDTYKDPYNAQEGFLYSHFGWMLLTPDKTLVKKSDYDISDLNEDYWVMFQNKHYGICALVMGFIFPTVVAGLWGDFRGGYFFAAILRLVFVHHATFCVNSLAHWVGDQPFADRESPKDHFITAILTLGEGYHNFHHEFPTDYRNAIKWWQYDPTKWLIIALSKVGLTYDLIDHSDNQIRMGKWQIKHKNLSNEKRKYSWGPELEDLDTITWDEYQNNVKQGDSLIVIDNIVYEIEEFIPSHPGGNIIRSFIGKDATKKFHEIHSVPVTERILKSRRFALLDGVAS